MTTAPLCEPRLDPASNVTPFPAPSDPATAGPAAGSATSGSPTAAQPDSSVRPGSPAHQQLARTIAQAIADVLSGRRPSLALAGWFELMPLNKVQNRAGWEREASAAKGTPWPWRTLGVLSTHVQAQYRSPHSEALPTLECCASILTPRGVRAIAFTLKPHGRRLRCTDVQIG